MKRNLLQILSLPIGMISLALGIILNRFLPENELTDFCMGFLLGLSIVLNIYYMIKVAKKNKD